MSLSKKTFLLLSLLVLVIANCGGPEFDRSQILTNAADNLILPAYEDFDNRVNLLHVKAEAFVAGPETSALREVQDAWKDAKSSWKRAEIFNFGPVEELLLVTAIDRWPTSENGIERIISNYDGSENFLVQVGSNRKGLPAIEYLLFHADDETIFQEFSDENRKAYLLLLTEALTRNSNILIEAWENGYKEEFISNSGNNASSGITLLANELGYQLQKVRQEKLGNPFGEQTEGTPRLQVLESEFAGYSKDLIRQNLISAQRTFNGADSTGFDDYLDALDVRMEDGTLLSHYINQSFIESLEKLDDIDGSLEEAILNQRPKVQALIESVQKVYVAIEVDMISQLGILIVFSDNDGD